MKHYGKPRRLFAAILAAALLLGNGQLLTIGAAQAPESPAGQAASRETSSQENLWELLREKATQPELERLNDYAPTDEVTVIVELEEEPLLESGAVLTQARMMQLSGDHDQIKVQIRSLAGEQTAAASAAAEPGYDYYEVMNGFSIVTQYQYLEHIQALDGVKRVYVERAYEAPVAEPSMASSAGMIGATAANESGYDGQGMVIAVLDTGLDVSHEAFATAPQAPKYSREAMGQLLETQQLSAKRVSLNRVFISEKIPFIYDYTGIST